MVFFLASEAFVFAQDKKPLRSMLPQNSMKNFQHDKTLKISLQLSSLQDEYQTGSRLRQAGKPDLPSRYKNVYMMQGNKILVELIAENSTQTLVSDMKKLDFDEVAAYQRMVSGWLDLGDINKLNSVGSLLFARPVRIPHKNAGSVDSQGDLAMGSPEAREKLGIDGTGTTVGILSDSYNFLQGEKKGIASGDLPGPGNPEGYTKKVNVLLDADTIADYNAVYAFTDEGRGMAEIVHDVAPGAGLAFYTAYLGQPSFASGIIQLQDEAKCDVIVDDIYYFAEPFFQDGIIAQAADEVSRKGTTYLSSAGNSARDSYESEFRPSKPIVLYTDSATYGDRFPIGDYELHDFDPGPGVNYFQKVDFPGSLNLSFQWDNAYASACSDCTGAESDLDIFIFLRKGDFSSFYDGGLDVNVGADPIETLAISSDFPQEAYIVIGKYLGAGGPNPDPTTIKYVDFGSGMTKQYATNSSTVVGHSNAKATISVGAVPYYLTPAYGSPEPVLESFSSAGGTPIFYDKFGNRIAREVREKPEVSGPDGANTSFFLLLSGDVEGDGFPNFFGTSASAPHVAGVAALMQQEAGKALEPSQIKTLLTRTALDMDDPYTPGFDYGFDFGTGYGFVQAGKALDAVNSQRVTQLVLVDANTNKDIGPLSEGDRIVLSSLGTKNLAIRAETDPPYVGSVKINIEGAINTSQIENSAPYASFGDNKGKLNGKEFAFGDYTVEAIPYSDKMGKGKTGLPLQVSFQMVEQVKSMTLVDAMTDKDIEELSYITFISPADYGNQLNIRANVSAPKNIGSVKFVLKYVSNIEIFEVYSKVENYYPYSLFGDEAGGDYLPGTFEDGVYVLEATPYSKQNAKGTAGERLSDILIVDNGGLSASASRQINVYPNPVSNQEQLRVDIRNIKPEKAQFTLTDMDGKEVYATEKYFSGTIDPTNLPVGSLNLKPGLYFLKVAMPGKEVQTVRLLKQQ